MKYLLIRKSCLTGGKHFLKIQLYAIEICTSKLAGIGALLLFCVKVEIENSEPDPNENGT